ncbi:MAG: efflux RND transporter periplasmic adaptor subunit [Thermodesulfobacteriota bacterium]
MAQENKDHIPETRKEKALRFVWGNLPRLLLLGLLVLFVALIGRIGEEKARLAEEKAAAQAQGRKPVNAVLLELQPHPIRDAINLPGMIEPWTRLELLARVNGAIDEVLVREGERVTAGQVLARIEEDDYRIALDAARAAHAHAKADFARKKAMLAKKTVPLAEVELSEAQLLTARAAMEDAELRLARCTITAPMAGVVRRLDAKVGLFLNIGDPVGELLELDRVKAVVGIPESDVAAVRAIDQVEVEIQALEGRRITGRKYFLAPSPENVARLYRLELELANGSGDLLPGMFLRAQVVKKVVADALAVPIYSVITRNNEQYVFVVRDGVVHRQPVQLGIMENWLIQVVEGLKPGDLLVVEGHREVEEGQPVNVLKVLTEATGLSL